MADSDVPMDEKVVSSELVYDGRAIKVRRSEVVLPKGTRISREVIMHGGSVSMVPILEDGRVVLIRQFRLAAKGVIWEVPAGTIEVGEAPEACARRELEEETGFVASDVRGIFRGYLAPGYSTEMMHFFVAKGLKKTQQATEEDEAISVEPVEPRRVLEMVASGEITDAKTVAAISYLFATGEFK